MARPTTRLIPRPTTKNQKGRPMPISKRLPAASDATTRASVVVAPKKPCAVEARPGGVPCARDDYSLVFACHGSLITEPAATGLAAGP